MPLEVHHLGLSQSERILFLLEELSIPYTLIKYDRAPSMAPATFKSLPGNQTGQAPFVVDPDSGITLSESGAIVDYILSKYAKSARVKLFREYGDPDYKDYIYFLHFANATLQPAMAQAMLLSVLTPAPNPEHPMVKYVNANVQRCLGILDAQLATHKWVAGDEFTAADCMAVYSLTTKRYFGPLVGYEKFPNVVRYLTDIGARPGYQRAMEKGDPEMQPLLGSEPPKENLLLVGGVEAGSWKRSAK